MIINECAFLFTKTLHKIRCYFPEGLCWREREFLFWCCEGWEGSVLVGERFIVNSRGDSIVRNCSRCIVSLFYKHCGMGYVCELETIAIYFPLWSYNLGLATESAINPYG